MSPTIDPGPFLSLSFFYFISSKSRFHTPVTLPQTHSFFFYFDMVRFRINLGQTFWFWIYLFLGSSLILDLIVQVFLFVCLLFFFFWPTVYPSSPHSGLYTLVLMTAY